MSIASSRGPSLAICQYHTLIVNRKVASALGIDVPLGLLLAADEVME